jgi:hypothetical protein
VNTKLKKVHLAKFEKKTKIWKRREIEIKKKDEKMATSVGSKSIISFTVEGISFVDAIIDE